MFNSTIYKLILSLLARKQSPNLDTVILWACHFCSLIKMCKFMYVCLAYQQSCQVIVPWFHKIPKCIIPNERSRIKCHGQGFEHKIIYLQSIILIYISTCPFVLLICKLTAMHYMLYTMLHQRQRQWTWANVCELWNNTLIPRCANFYLYIDRPTALDDVI